MPTIPDDDSRAPIAPGVWLDESAMSFTFSRGGGPGGQNVNKVNTHATLTLPLEALENAMPAWAFARLCDAAGRYLADKPPRLVIHASDSRSQLANRRSCVLKLRQLIVAAMNRPRIRRPTRPSAAAKQRRLDAKKHRSQIKSQRRAPDDG
ncbi:alternative ribosome rescue aminoacyl-tRNA hydrolase ArfB [Algisphaera agarilytica]|uniref:Ribosome-associated protein n=1 Tax=Algisphaera agarilytica TaxID=1385975 RepID=A0A7X0LKK3_9BACT|nr:alternative ribosome rescue aminoacyl-tRNA hydrolase ArfB [Algisphaera agarilytica]MBB6429048.1 ribosome-associated protein [Algisphaera agarilytica]